MGDSTERKRFDSIRFD